MRDYYWGGGQGEGRGGQGDRGKGVQERPDNFFAYNNTIFLSFVIFVIFFLFTPQCLFYSLVAPSNSSPAFISLII